MVPGEWKAANVSPIFKSGDKTSVNNYRPISILQVLAKVFEKLVHQQLYVYLQKHKILHLAQSGFRPGHTTQDVIVASVDDWRRGLVIDSELNWEKHVAAVRKKCFGGLATLRRLRNTLLVSLKSGLFNALIRPYLDYCSVVWQECSKVQQGKLEQIQNYGMRQILSMPPRTPSELLRGILEWDQLAKCRMMLRLQLMHRCMHVLVPGYLCSCFQLNSSLPNYARTRGWNNIHLHCPNTNWYKKLFEYTGAKDWNSLPSDLKSVTSKSTFKTYVKSIL